MTVQDIDNQICEEYFIQASMSYDIKNDVLTQPSPKHNDPSDYGLTQKEVTLMRIRYLRGLKKLAQREETEWRIMLLKVFNDYRQKQLLEAQRDVAKINKEIAMNIAKLRLLDNDGNIDQTKMTAAAKSYDIAAIKLVPINTITEVLSNGFFQNNPFRNEKSPSNSLYWYKKQNRWTDFGTGKSGDVIDLFMAINGVSMPEALRELSKY